MAHNKKLQAALMAVLILLFGGVVYLGYQATQPPDYGDLGDDEVADAREPREPIVSPRTDGQLDPGSGDVIAGGVERPASDLPRKREQPEAVDPERFPYGQITGVATDANPDAASVAEALANPRAYPERLSAVHAPREVFDPRKFDPESDAFDEDYRDDYLTTVEPGRVFQPAQPGPGVPRLSRGGQVRVEAAQDETIPLQVTGLPGGSPVTFTSFDLGSFENELTSITVVADRRGVASTAFTAGGGTINNVRVVAASPVASGQARWSLFIKPTGSDSGGGAAGNEGTDFPRLGEVSEVQSENG